MHVLIAVLWNTWFASGIFWVYSVDLWQKMWVSLPQRYKKYLFPNHDCDRLPAAGQLPVDRPADRTHPSPYGREAEWARVTRTLKIVLLSVLCGTSRYEMKDNDRLH